MLVQTEVWNIRACEHNEQWEMKLGWVSCNKTGNEILATEQVTMGKNWALNLLSVRYSKNPVQFHHDHPVFLSIFYKRMNLTHLVRDQQQPASPPPPSLLPFPSLFHSLANALRTFFSFPLSKRIKKEMKIFTGKMRVNYFFSRCNWARLGEIWKEDANFSLLLVQVRRNTMSVEREMKQENFFIFLKKMRWR